MNYKALLCDVDGTLVPNARDGMPSLIVQEAISKISKKIHVGIATSRPLHLVEHIIESLSLSGPSIINGGAQVYDIDKKEYTWERVITSQDYNKCIEIIRSYNVRFFVHDNGDDVEHSSSYIPRKLLMIVVINLEPHIADKILSDLSHIPSIAVHKALDWEKGKMSLTVTHAEATKQHGVFQVAKDLNIETHEIVGIGDGYNDFPLLMACGLKVAMGSAPEDLKAIADYVAPPVERDGVADVITKFLL